MASINKYIKLQHTCSKNMEYFMFGICSIIPVEVLIMFLLDNNGTEAKLLNIVNITFTISAIISLLFLSISFNIINIKTMTFYRATRRNYYKSLLCYLAIVTIILSFVSLLFNFVPNLIFGILNNRNLPMSFLWSLGQFISFVLLLFSLALLFNICSMIVNFYEQNLVILFIVLPISFYPLNIYEKN